MDVWQRAVDSQVFNPRFKSYEMKSRMTDGHPEASLLSYVGRLGAGMSCMFVFALGLRNVTGTAENNRCQCESYLLFLASSCLDGLDSVQLERALTIEF